MISWTTRERQVGGGELDGEDDSVDIVKEVQVDVGDVARHRSGAFGEHHAYCRYIRAPVDA